MRAFYTLEAGINIDDGTSGQGGMAFGRQSLIGLQTRYGQFSLGRQYSSVYTAVTDFSIFSNNPTGPSTAVIGGFGGGYEPTRGAGGTAVPPAAGATGNSSPSRVNNSVRYQSPEWNGLTATMLYGAGELAGRTNDSRLLDLGLRYRISNFDAMLSYVDDKTVANGGIGTGGTTTTLAGSYSFSPFRVVVGYLDFSDKRAANQDGKGYWIGGDYRIGNHLLKAQWVRNEPKYGSDNKTDAFGVGWQYDLSKRTALYSSLTKFKNGSNAGDGLGRFNSAIPTGLTAIGSNSITEMVAGIRHSF